MDIENEIKALKESVLQVQKSLNTTLTDLLPYMAYNIYHRALKQSTIKAAKDLLEDVRQVLIVSRQVQYCISSIRAPLD